MSSYLNIFGDRFTRESGIDGATSDWWITLNPTDFLVANITIYQHSFIFNDIKNKIDNKLILQRSSIGDVYFDCMATNTDVVNAWTTFRIIGILKDCEMEFDISETKGWIAIYLFPEEVFLVDLAEYLL